MKIVLLLVAVFVFAHAEEAKKEDAQADPAVYYSKQVVYHSKPVVTYHTSTQVVHGGSHVVHTSSSSSSKVVKVTHSSSSKVGRGGCPGSNPYAYYSGSYCCRYTREKVYTPQGSLCDGSTISFGSKCCLNDKYVKCPLGAGKCRNYRLRPYPKFAPGKGAACSVDLFQHINYRGVKNTYTKAVSLVKRNDDMSSLKVGNGCCVIIYQHSRYRGKSKKICKNTSWIGKGWNDIVSSIKIVRGDEEEEEFDEDEEIEE